MSGDAPSSDRVFGFATRALHAVPGPVEVVDIFRDPAAVPALVEDAITIGATAIWMQLGVIHEAAAEPWSWPGSGDGPLHEDRTCALLRGAEHDWDEYGDYFGAQVLAGNLGFGRIIVLKEFCVAS